MLVSEDATSAPNQTAVHELVQVDYSRALRAIGQDLTDLFPRTLDIENDGTSFIARGQSHANPFQNYRRSTYKDFWRNLLGKKAEEEPVVVELATLNFERTYAPADIDRLDRLYSASRTGQLGRPDNYSLAERLRVMGGMVTSRMGRLKRLHKNADNLSVEYWDLNGELRTAKLTTVIMYRNPEYPLSHSAKPRELWEGYDF